MKIKCIGTGSAFTLKNYHTNFILEDNGKNMLVDAGSDLRFSLKDIGMSYKDIDATYISHNHIDHNGGIEYLAFTSYFDPSFDRKIMLYGASDVIRRSWNTSWKGGLESVQGQVNSLEDYFDVNMIRPNSSFRWQGIDFQIIQVVHVMNGFSIIPSYGIMLTLSNGMKIFFTTDTQHAPHQLIDMYNSADLIIQDCETLPFKSGVHANYMDLKDLPCDIKKKMYLVHYQDNVIGEDGKVSYDWNVKAYADMFAGFLNKGDVIDTDKVLLGLATIDE